MLTACGHDPEERPGVSRRMMVLTVGPETSGPNSLIEPSSAVSRVVVFCTIQSRIGWSSAFEATTSHSSVTNWSSAWRRWASAEPETPEACVMEGPFDGEQTTVATQSRPGRQPAQGERRPREATAPEPG